MTPKVSIVIATRNRYALLPRAVESALRAGSNVEIIVVDDASDDRTPEVCGRWVDAPCFRYLRTSRCLGPGGARNVGLIASTSPYVSFLDDDDIRLPLSLDVQLELLEAHPNAGMVYGRALYGDEDCVPDGGFYPEQCPQGDLFWDLLRSNFIPCPTVVFRRACLARVGLLEEEAPGVEDWDLWVRIAELYTVLATEQAVAVWRRATPKSGQFTSHPEGLHRETRRLHRERWLRLPRVTEAGTERRRKAVRAFSDSASQQLVWEAAARLKAKQLPDFARVALAGARMYPISSIRKMLGASTWLSLISRLGKVRRGERTQGWEQK